MFNPRVGLTTNFLVGELILKPRIAWGRGITPPSWRDKNPPPGTSQSQIFVPNPDLKPQQQAGWDYGLEGYLGDNLRFEVSRYDYILNDGIYTASSAGRLQVLNGGKIANDGWEFSASYKLKNFRISGTYSIMDAILKEPVSGKVTKNDLTLPGEQMLFIPRDVAGFIIGYNFPKIFSHSDKLSASISMTYTSGAPTIDYVKYTYDFFINNNFSNFINYGFRYYKTQLLSVTRFNLNVEYDLYKDLRFFMQLSNIGDNTNPEYDNTFPSIGRGWMFGLKYNFSKTAGTDQ
jgi:outer membrane receptor protein involved in Fe transport